MGAHDRYERPLAYRVVDWGITFAIAAALAGAAVAAYLWSQS